MKPKVYIDGKEGTTGLQIYERLGGRDDLELLLIDEDKRKDTEERRRFLNAADIVFLCLPDAAAKEAVGLIENKNTRVIDASTAHRVDAGWIFGFPELAPGQRERIAAASLVSNPGCYSTGAIAMIAPLIAAGLIEEDEYLAINAVSGYSGGGKALIAEYEDGGAPEHFVYALTQRHKQDRKSVV